MHVASLNHSAEALDALFATQGIDVNARDEVRTCLLTTQGLCTSSKERTNYLESRMSAMNVETRCSCHCSWSGIEAGLDWHISVSKPLVFFNNLRPRNSLTFQGLTHKIVMEFLQADFNSKVFILKIDGNRGRGAYAIGPFLFCFSLRFFSYFFIELFCFSLNPGSYMRLEETKHEIKQTREDTLFVLPEHERKVLHARAAHYF